MCMPRTTMLTPDRAATFAGMRVLICGASGNLGGHIARQLAEHGARLSLWGRNDQRLDDLANCCRRKGAEVAIRSIDLCNVEAALTALRQDDDLAPFDCAFFVSGAGDTRQAGRVIESPAQLIRLGLLNFIAPAALSAELGERMALRGKGRIAIVGTAAATHPIPFAAGYTSSKCGVSHFAESLRIALWRHGVSVTLISPGFFAAAAEGAYSYARPGELSAQLVAQRTIRAVARKRAELITPWFFVPLRWIGRVLPRAVRDRLLLSLPTP